jgi:nucleoside-diphosphate-sugar epimerase
MNIAVTGATGFLGRYMVNRFTAAGHRCRCWYRADSDRSGFARDDAIDWVEGALDSPAAADAICERVDAVVHSALHHPGGGFRGGEGDIVEFVTNNIVGTIRLIESARRAGVERFVFISTCAVHEVILEDRKLDESHPLWPKSHYGAHKAAIEKFVHSYGLREAYEICALRPTGIYGLATPAVDSKWYKLVHGVRNGDPISSPNGGKDVHADDVAKACEILLTADGVAGQAYNCYDRYIAVQEVAEIAKRITGSDSTIERINKGPVHQICTDKLRALGMEFGGAARLEQTVRELLEH